MVSTGPIAARFDGTAWTRAPQPIRDLWTPLVADADGTIWTLLDPEDAPGWPETLTIQYTAPDLRAPSLVRFRTRMEGQQAGWTYQGTARQVTYVTYRVLPPGDYTFHVEAMNAGGA